jgi:HKD family nuclease
MTLLVSALGDHIASALSNVDEIWVAVALCNDEGFEELQTILPDNIIQHYLIGIDLPTTVSVLKTIKSKIKPGSFTAKISKKGQGSFHPKVYLFRKNDRYGAVVGSGNMTKGGFFNNTELNIHTENQTVCLEIKAWFIDLFTIAYPLNDENIRRYESKWRSFDKEHQNLMKMQNVQLVKTILPGQELDDINFDDRYFKKEHHLAFRPALWQDDSPAANTERNNVWNRFSELHKDIYPSFSEFNLGSLHPNVPNHLVSMPYHFPGRTQQDLNAMWLSYGKSQPEIKKYHEYFPKVGRTKQDEEDDLQSFINHARLQIRIEYLEIGIWILFAKNNGGGLFDRDNFKKKMKSDDYCLDFYSQLKSLPAPYWIRVNDVKKDVHEFNSPDILRLFTNKDNERNYFIIGRDYAIEDNEMSEVNLPGEVLKEFKRLYPLYKMMRHYF